MVLSISAAIKLCRLVSVNLLQTSNSIVNSLTSARSTKLRIKIDLQELKPNTTSNIETNIGPLELKVSTSVKRKQRITLIKELYATKTHGDGHDKFQICHIK